MRYFLKGTTVSALIGTCLMLASCTEKDTSEPSDAQQTIESITEAFEHPETKQKF